MVIDVDHIPPTNPTPANQITPQPSITALQQYIPLPTPFPSVNIPAVPVTEPEPEQQQSFDDNYDPSDNIYNHDMDYPSTSEDNIFQMSLTNWGQTPAAANGVNNTEHITSPLSPPFSDVIPVATSPFPLQPPHQSQPVISKTSVVDAPKVASSSAVKHAHEEYGFDEEDSLLRAMMAVEGIAELDSNYGPRVSPPQPLLLYPYCSCPWTTAS